MDRSQKPISLADMLYPAIAPFDQRMLDVGDGHMVYVEQVGNPRGVPVLVVHGGPGGGCSPFMRRYFDPKGFRIILFDQRGCGRSTPRASTHANTSWHLVRDMEAIRTALDIEAWHLFGGSWGATLALIYAQSHPERALSLVLRGVFLMTRPELDWFYGGGAGLFWPDLWEKFIAPIPESERGDLIAAYNKRLFCGDYAEELRFAQRWASWENALASVSSDGQMGQIASAYAHAFSRLENHYFHNMGWLDEERAILNRMGRIADLPGVIVQGRQDMICPPRAAHDLAALWPEARLRMIPGAGHAMSEPGIIAALLQETDALL